MRAKFKMPVLLKSIFIWRSMIIASIPGVNFFRIAPEKVVAAIQLANPTDITPLSQPYDSEEEERASEKETPRRRKINLAAIKVSVGTTLYFSRDKEIMATVMAGNKIEFERNETSFSAAAGELLSRMGR